MKLTLTLFTVLLLAPLGALHAADNNSKQSPTTAVMLAAGGVARSVIVVDAETPSLKPNAHTVNAIAGLQSGLEQVTGAKFTVKTAGTEVAGESCIYVGRCAADKLGINPAELAENEWAIRAGGSQVYLTGGRFRGTANAVWRFLEDAVGVRFWSKWEMETPKRAELKIEAFSKRGNPAFCFCFATGIHPSQGMTAGEFGGSGNGEVVMNMAHGTMSVVPPKKYFKEHPEWYAEVGGERQSSGQKSDYCMSAEGLTGEYAVQLGRIIDQKRAAAAQKGTRAPHVYGMGREDNAGWCECQKCLAYYKQHSKSDLYLAFVNEVAKRIAKTHPDVLLLHSAYQATGPLPKTQKPRDNVLVWYCTEGMDFSKSINDPANTETRNLIKGWRVLTRHLGVWHYGRSFERYGGKYQVSPGMAGTSIGLDWPLATVQNFPEFLQFLKQSGVRYGYVNNSDAFLSSDTHVLKTWIHSKLIDDPSRDVEALLKTFTDGYYGPAGGDVRVYLEWLQRNQQELPPKIYFFANLMAYRHLTLENCLAADKILATAEQKVAQAPHFRDRIRFLRATTMDRVFAFKWKNFLHHWSAQGNPLETFPIRQPDLLERARQAGIWYGNLRGSDQAPRFITAVAKWAEFAQNQLFYFPNLPVPEKFAALPPAAVWQFPAPSYAFDRTGQKTARENDDFGQAAAAKDNAALVADETAVGHQALSIAGPAIDLEWSFIRNFGGKDPDSARKAPVADLEGAYRWVKLGTYTFDTVNTGLDFTFGERKWKFYALDPDPGRYEAWLSARHDKSSGTLFVERVVLAGAASKERPLR